jgi:signal transduction histidine kinase
VPIRLRLAGTSALLTLFILCVFAVAIGTLTTRRIRSDFNHQVAAAASDLRDRLNILVDPSTGRIARIDPPLDLYAAPEHAVARVLTEDGSVLAQTYKARNIGPPFATSSNFNGYRVESRAARLRNGYTLYVQYARPLSELNDTISRVRLFLIIGVLGGTGLAFAAGAMIARRAMAPIAALTATAREIQRTRDPRLSMPTLPGDDEVSELAHTLENMLGALADARAESEATLARQRQFVADASHELRTPLTSVLANLELLADSLHGDQGEAATSALRSSQRMRRLVADLLLLARADVGRPGPTETVDLADVAIEAAAELGPISADHDLALDVRPANVAGVRDDLHRLTINLIENAVRHTPPGTEVRVTVGPSPDGTIKLVVEDDGPGVSEELKPRLFERFVRGSGDSGGSFGLGLAIVRAVVDAHGGSVAVEAAASGGARFVVSLPLEAQPARAIEIAAK